MADWKTYAGRGVLKAAWWAGAAAMVARRTKPYGAIFTLHHVSPEPQGNFPPNGHLRVGPAFLEALIGHLRAKGADFIDLSEAVRRIEARQQPTAHGRFFVAFTLDDGYCNNLIHAAPVFRREEVPYAVFVSPGLSDGSTLPWWEVIETVVRNNRSVAVPFAEEPLASATSAEKRDAFDSLSLYLANRCPEAEIDREVRRIAVRNGVAAPDAASRVMDWTALRQLAEDPYCTIGAHSMTHPRLSRLPAAEVLRELQHSREVIGEQLGRRPDFFAYPYGSRDACGPREFDIAATVGYRAAFTTRLHALTDRTARNIHALPRLSLNGYYQDPRYVDVLISGLPGRWKERRS